MCFVRVSSSNLKCYIDPRWIFFSTVKALYLKRKFLLTQITIIRDVMIDGQPKLEMGQTGADLA